MYYGSSRKPAWVRVAIAFRVERRLQHGTNTPADADRRIDPDVLLDGRCGYVGSALGKLLPTWRAAILELAQSRSGGIRDELRLLASDGGVHDIKNGHNGPIDRCWSCIG
jgi:hypothetical protein